MKKLIIVVSLSGGKDSTATALMAIELHGRDNCIFVFADTGNEDATTYDYIRYLEHALAIKVIVVKAEFSEEIATKRGNLARIAAGEPETAVYGKRQFKYHWTPETAAKALEFLHPTGNPFLDLCMLKGGFPSRKRQFCTEYLKRNPITEYQLGLVDQGYHVESWQGVRADESASRRWLPSYEWREGGISIYRPILRWNVDDVFAAHRAAGISPNPLYRQGMSRVGCMPCINCGKDELDEISKRFPEHIERIANWERLVQTVTRPGSNATFFHKQKQGANGVAAAVQWARTTRGGRQFNLLSSAAPLACASNYGLCE